MKISTKLIVALDVDSFSKAKHFVDLLYPQIKIFKVGLQLFTACGDEIIRYIKAKGGKVFLDLKFFDIPNTVAQASRQVVQKKIDMFTVHSQGGLQMMKQTKVAVQEEAKKLGIKPPKIIGVSVLTSEANKGKIIAQVLGLARFTQKAGLDGIVCSAKEAKTLRRKLGKNFIIITPAIRMPSDKKQDQKRTATAQEAIKAGSNFLVIGRPILEADEPLEAIKKIVQSEDI